jgi:hypothetical protein
LTWVTQLGPLGYNNLMECYMLFSFPFLVFLLPQPRSYEFA